jgi:hypothetical protein
MQLNNPIFINQTDADNRYVNTTGDTINGNINSLGNYYVKVARLTDQTILNATDTVIQFSRITDPNSWYNTGTYRITPTVSGNYYVSAMVNWVKGTIAPTDQNNIQIRKNGATFSINLMPVNSGMDFTASLFGITTLNGSSDYIDVTAYTSNPTSQDINGTADGSWTKMELFKLN